MIDGGRLVAKALKKEGISAIFTLSGGHIMSIYNGCLDEGIRVVDVRHEQAAAHAADAWARVTGHPGVAVVTAGPGVTDAVTGIANAYQAESPLLVIGGQAPLGQIDMGALQEMDHVELLRPISRWARSVHTVSRIPEYIASAFRHSLTHPFGPVFLEMPTDVLFSAAEEAEVEYPDRYRTEARAGGDPEYIARAIALIEQARKPVVMAGASLWWCRAWDAMAAFLEKAKVPVYLNSMGRGCVPPDHPDLFSLTRKHALGQADVAVVIGTPLDFRLGFGKAPSFGGETKVIQIDVTSDKIGRNRPVDVGIVGDTAAILTQIAGGLGPVADRGEWFAELRAREKAARDRMEAGLRSDAEPIHPLRLLREIRDITGPETIVVGDGGNIVSNAAKVIPTHAPGHWLDTGRFGCLGVGPPFALAAKLARPDKTVLIIEGDGSFGFNGMEFDTLVRHKVPVVMVIGNDGSWNQIREPQLGIYGADRAVATALTVARYDKVVEALGGYGEFVERPGDIRPALDRALASGKPACVNVRINPAENTGSYGGMGL